MKRGERHGANMEQALILCDVTTKVLVKDHINMLKNKLVLLTSLFTAIDLLKTCASQNLFNLFLCVCKLIRLISKIIFHDCIKC